MTSPGTTLVSGLFFVAIIRLPASDPRVVFRSRKNYDHVKSCREMRFVPFRLPIDENFRVLGQAIRPQYFSSARQLCEIAVIQRK
jgi:hypothetical protein